MKVHLRYCSHVRLRASSRQFGGEIVDRDETEDFTSFELEPAGGGCFELTVDGKLVYSKLETGEFPNEFDLVSEVRSLA